MPASVQTILVVDDDARLRQLLSDYIARQGYFVATAASAAEAKEKLRWLAFDAMILDRMMPGQNGLDLAREIRQHTSLPILMLTAMSEAEQRIEGLEAGVADYLTKPFEPRELVLRLKNLLQREAHASFCQFGPYRFNARTGQLMHADRQIHLTAAEAAYLKRLSVNFAEAVSREKLAEAAGQSEANMRTIDVQMGRLRKKIEPDPSRPIYIHTVRGAGYALKG